MEEKKVSTLFEDMRNDISRFITSTLELGKLEAYEKISLSASAIVYGLIWRRAAVRPIVYPVTAGLYLGELLQSSGSASVSCLVYPACTLIILLVGKSFKKKFASRVVRFS